MRRLVVCLVLFLVTISAATGVQASTACEKWLQEYRDSLKKSPAMHRAKAAHHRLHHYIHRKIAKAKKKPAAPKPRVLPAHRSKPKMTREELLKKLELACGDLPQDNPKLAELVGTNPTPDFLPEEHGDEGQIELASNDGGIIPLLPPPGYSTPGVTPPGGGTPGTPFFPPLGGGGKPPNTPVTSTSTPPDGPPTDAVPEPGTLVLLLTGIPAAVGATRRKCRPIA